ncbi:MAG: hypothetical protein Q7R59_01670 [bacterium]|nr:hypothetical protein [bacterium]
MTKLDKGTVEEEYSLWLFLRGRFSSFFRFLKNWYTNHRVFAENSFGLLAIIISLVTAVFTYQGIQIANKTILLSTEPQVDFYLQPTGIDTGRYIFGIENNGTVSIENVSSSYSVANIYKKNCLNDSTEITCGGGAAGISEVFSTREQVIPLKPAESRTFELLMSTSSDVINSLSITTHYKRSVDKKKYVTTVTYFIDDTRIFTLDSLRDIPTMQPYIASFRHFSAESTLGGYRVYWK